MTVMRRLALAGLLFYSPLAACDADDTAKLCVSADLIAQCPVGSNPILGASAEEGCDGQFSDNIVSGDTGASGQCRSSGSCEFLCQFEVPCSCGVLTITKDEIVCAACTLTSCGDGRCEGNERATCAPGNASCIECGEDCGGATCGDGDCTGSETPALCPQDCGGSCTPSAKDCLGPIARVCQANGAGYDSFDCSTTGQTCREGVCVAR